ncbi:hypothetical protein PR002_g14449 [Phytophthora rubi]|uniref:Uncharacterized protein n=1 Tax=Phytophthora rubi TaxID=129364 RepID=A0A6A3LC51_9STRA|nr:hypothetical protein PR002_g14449 [Phytophthora rubi]
MTGSSSRASRLGAGGAGRANFFFRWAVGGSHRYRLTRRHYRRRTIRQFGRRWRSRTSSRVSDFWARAAGGAGDEGGGVDGVTSDMTGLDAVERLPSSETAICVSAMKPPCLVVFKIKITAAWSF